MKVIQYTFLCRLTGNFDDTLQKAVQGAVS